MSFMID